MKRKFHSWHECVSLREVQSLRKLSHPHVVQFKEVIRENDSSLYFVFEYMQDGNLYEFIKNRKGNPIPSSKIRSILSQVLEGLSFMHLNGYFHRDMKPENLLLRGDVCKVADFGLAKEIRALPPFTGYVSTRWYRAPEVLLRSRRYGSAIDLFAVGCIMAELYNLQPLFPGETEIDQITKVCNVLGSPSLSTWPEGVKLAMKSHCHLIQAPLIPLPLDQIIYNTTPDAIDLLTDLLKLDPSKRVSASKALQYHYFDVKPINKDLQRNGIISPKKRNCDDFMKENILKNSNMTVKESQRLDNLEKYSEFGNLQMKPMSANKIISELTEWSNISPLNRFPGIKKKHFVTSSCPSSTSQEQFVHNEASFATISTSGPRKIARRAQFQFSPTCIKKTSPSTIDLPHQITYSWPLPDSIKNSNECLHFSSNSKKMPLLPDISVNQSKNDAPIEPKIQKIYSSFSPMLTSLNIRSPRTNVIASHIHDISTRNNNTKRKMFTAHDRIHNISSDSFQEKEFFHEKVCPPNIGFPSKDQTYSLRDQTHASAQLNVFAFIRRNSAPDSNPGIDPAKIYDKIYWSNEFGRRKSG